MRQTKYHQERQAQAREEGRCIWCLRSAAAYSLCARHRKQLRLRATERHDAGLCPRCGSEDHDGESWACEPCREQHSERKLALVETGLCRTCGRPNDSEFQTCDDCRERYNAARRARRAAHGRNDRP